MVPNQKWGIKYKKASPSTPQKAGVQYPRAWIKCRNKVLSWWTIRLSEAVFVSLFVKEHKSWGSGRRSEMGPLWNAKPCMFWQPLWRVPWVEPYECFPPLPEVIRNISTWPRDKSLIHVMGWAKLKGNEVAQLSPPPPKCPHHNMPLTQCTTTFLLCFAKLTRQLQSPEQICYC